MKFGDTTSKKCVPLIFKVRYSKHNGPYLRNNPGYYDHKAPAAEKREDHFKILLDRITGTLNILTKKFC